LPSTPPHEGHHLPDHPHPHHHHHEPSWPELEERARELERQQEEEGFLVPASPCAVALRAHELATTAGNDGSTPRPDHHRREEEDQKASHGAHFGLAPLRAAKDELALQAALGVPVPTVPPLPLAQAGGAAMSPAAATAEGEEEEQQEGGGEAAVAQEENVIGG
jgi:hypothetical protein